MNEMYLSMCKKLSEKRLKEQVVKPVDYYDEDGLLVCGVCGEHRQFFQEVSLEKPGKESVKTCFKTTKSCRCDNEAELKRLESERYEHDCEYVANLKKESMIDPKFATASFDDFQITKYNDRNCKLCKRYATAFDIMLAKNQGLLLWGPVGTGKSYAAACIANYLMEHKHSVVIVSFVKMMEMSPEMFDSILLKIQYASLVIFDDLGAERDTSFAFEKVYSVIDTRYKRGLPMIFTTNLTLTEMQTEKEIRRARIYDRILEACSYPMQFTGPSFRKNIAYERFNEMKDFFADIE